MSESSADEITERAIGPRLWFLSNCLEAPTATHASATVGMKKIPIEAIPSTAATVNRAAARKVERRLFATTGTSAINAGSSKTTTTAAPSVATRDAWLDVQEEIPVDVVEHEDVETSGAEISATPVAAAAPRVRARQPRASTATHNVVLLHTIPVGVPRTDAPLEPDVAAVAVV